MPYIVSNCSNNYGPFQFPEKLIPVIINNIVARKPLPVYGDGQNTRDWLYVEDHVKAIDLIVHKGELGETYNIGGHNEVKNIDLVKRICDIVDEQVPDLNNSQELISFVTDRPGHDFRYAIDASKIERELGWTPDAQLEQGLENTVRWYLENPEWVKRIHDGTYQDNFKA